MQSPIYAALLNQEQDIPKPQAALFARYYELLIQWNERLNLTAITEPQQVVKKHFLDSLLAAEDIPHSAVCIDIGSGAGFPGVPLKIMRPDIKLVMIDSLNKRVNFLKALCEELGFKTPECRALHLRAEEAGALKEYRETFDIALTRAVAKTAALLEWSAPLLKVGGVAILYKGAPATAEVELQDAQNALNALDMKADFKAFSPQWGARSLIICRKLKPTSRKFPRKPGEALRNPL